MWRTKLTEAWSWTLPKNKKTKILSKTQFLPLITMNKVSIHKIVYLLHSKQSTNAGSLRSFLKRKLCKWRSAHLVTKDRIHNKHQYISTCKCSIITLFFTMSIPCFTSYKNLIRIRETCLFHGIHRPRSSETGHAPWTQPHLPSCFTCDIPFNSTYLSGIMQNYSVIS